MDRQFKECGNIKWEITDENGYPITLNRIRDSRIGDILSEDTDPMDVLYNINLKIDNEKGGGLGGWGLYHSVFNGKSKILSTYSLGEGDVYVKLPCKDLKDAEVLLDLICRGNKMYIMPAFLINR